MGGRGSASTMSGREHTFTDITYDGYVYEGDGRDAIAFFDKNSNYNELINGMAEDQVNAFDAWAGGAFMGGQQWRGWDTMSNREKQWTQAYDDIIDQSTLSEGIVVTRNASARLVLDKRTASLEEFQAVEGSLVKVRGNMSTGAASSGLNISAVQKVEYKIHISAGTKGAGMWIGDGRINPLGADQREFMTNRDAWYKVGKSTHNKSNGMTTVHLYYQGHDVHDYGTTGRVQ